MNRFGDNGQVFRQSIINEYLSYCGLKIMFKYIYGEAPTFRSFKATFGTAIHYAISEVHKRNLFDKNDFTLLLKDGLQFAEFEAEGADIPVKWPDEWEEKAELIQNFMEDASIVLKNYCKNPRNKECKLVLNEATGTLIIAEKYKATFRIDQLRQYPDGTYELLDLKWSDKLVPSDARLRRSIQLILYAMGIKHGQIDGIGNLNILPNRIGIYNLKDHLEYQKPATPITGPDQLKDNKTSSYIDWF